MRKTLAIILAFAVLMGLMACSPKTQEKENNNSQKEEPVIDSSFSVEDPDNEVISGNNSPFHEPRVLISGGAVKVKDTLSNTYHKLNSENELTVAYLGGSVTVGTGGANGYCWRTATDEWFKTNFPNAKITSVDAGFGGTGSYWGFFRIDEDVLKENPDLVFVEFAINDAYAGHNELTSIIYMEGIVNKIRAKNKKADIIFVFVTDNNSVGRLGTEYTNLVAHKKVAEHYGIPYINVGFALVEEMKKTGNDWSYYVGDIVHPNNNGYKVYADCIAEHLKKMLITSPDKSGIKDHLEPENKLVTNTPTKSEIIKAEDIKNHSGFSLINSKSNSVAHMGPTLYGSEGAIIDIDFEGIGLGLIVDGEKRPTVKATLDSTYSLVLTLEPGINEITVFENLKQGKHSVKLEVVGGSKIVIGGFLIEK